LTEALQLRDPAMAKKVMDDTRGVANAMRMGQALASAEEMIPQITVPTGDSARAKTLPVPPAKQP
jgi:hypothetical protein